MMMYWVRTRWIISAYFCFLICARRIVRACFFTLVRTPCFIGMGFAKTTGLPISICTYIAQTTRTPCFVQTCFHALHKRSILRLLLMHVSALVTRTLQIGSTGLPQVTRTPYLIRRRLCTVIHIQTDRWDMPQAIPAPRFTRTIFATSYPSPTNR